MNHLRTVGLVVLVMIVDALGLGVMTTAAQGPGPMGPPGIPYVDRDRHTLPANSTQLLRFDYSLDYLNGLRPVTSIKLRGGYQSGVQIEIWTAEAVADMAHNKPIGRGTAIPLDCDTRQPTGRGQCVSPDLNWAGSFGGSGAYYINVVNSNNFSSTYQISIEGDGVSLGPATPTPTASPSTATALAVPTTPSAPTSLPITPPSVAPPATAVLATITLTSVNTPSAPASPTVERTAVPVAAAIPTATPTVNLDDPNRATTIRGAAGGTLAPKAVVWYRFDYANNHQTGRRPWVTITLVNGNGSGVAFAVYAPENIGEWWNNPPTGRGTVELIDCQTGQPSESGECQSPHLLWHGNFGLDGSYWIRVVNNNSFTADYILTLAQARPDP